MKIKTKENPYLKIDEYLHEIKVMQAEALLEIKNALSRMLRQTMKEARIKRGVLSEKNDYRNYVWLSIPDGDSEYWITTYYLDIDPKSGNIHAQIGRIQFWKNIHKNNAGAVASPNMLSEDGKHYLFCPENSFDPSIRIYDRNYSAEDVALAFNAFITKDRREKKSVNVTGKDSGLQLRFSVFDPAVDDYHKIPAAPGNYLVALKPDCCLPPCPASYKMTEYAGLKIIYTGVASKSLQKRDYQSHFKGTAGKSTLRMSLGCFWGYEFVPRDKNHPDNGKVMYSKADEDAITEWMKGNLLLLFCANDEFEKHEEQLISSMNPPLNLMKNHNPVNSEFRQWLTSQRTKR